MTASPPDRSRRRSRLTNRLALVVGLLGLALFVVARLGIAALPFDQHHVVSQFLGIGLALGALTQWR